MKETQKSTGSGSIQPSDKIEDSLRRMELNEDNTEQSSPYPDRPGERDCQFFLRTGHCGYGNICRYNHPRSHLPQGVNYYNDELPERIGQPDCDYFLKTGACKYGSTCKYHHPKDRNGAGPMLFNVLGYPMRQGEKSCPYYMQKGVCRFGVACKFHHPHPPNGHSTFGTSSYPYAGGFAMMPFPPATYGAMPPGPQVPQSYMPFMVSPSQGLLPPQGWASYMAASNPIYQPGSSSSASVPVSVTSHHHSFPERAECRFFMNNGTCKFGDDCKYSHPKDRMLLSPPNLPVRPGQPPCGNFKAYGFCKFGANCKFDHSMPVNPCNNTSLTITSLPTANVSDHLSTSPPPPGRSDSTTLSNGKPAAEKQDTLPPSRHSDSTALPNGKPAAEKQEEGKLEMQDISKPSHSDSTVLPNGKADEANLNAETEKQETSEVKDS